MLKLKEKFLLITVGIGLCGGFGQNVEVFADNPVLGTLRLLLKKMRMVEL